VRRRRFRYSFAEWSAAFRAFIMSPASAVSFVLAQQSSWSHATARVSRRWRCAVVASEGVPHRGQLCPAVAGERIKLIDRLLCAGACLAGFSQRSTRLASSLVEAVEFGDEFGNLVAVGFAQ